MSRTPLDIARSIGDRFVAWLGPTGRPDPAKCPWVTRRGPFSPTHAHSPPFMARALYLLYDATGDRRYKAAADRYAIFSFAFPRDPVHPAADRQRQAFLLQRLLAAPDAPWDPRAQNQILSRSWVYGCALWPAWGEFRRHNPHEDCYDARADALFEWVQRHRTDRGHAYNIGYRPTASPGVDVPDCAFTDDLRLTGTGIVAYYARTGQPEALEGALRLADYYLRDHQAGRAEGAFLPIPGTWCIGPWPLEIHCEHFAAVRMDQSGWGWTARGAVEFLTHLHACLPPEHPRAARMREVCVRSLRWQFTCQFPDGAVGMHTLDDHWLGMTAAPLLVAADLRRAGWLDAAGEAEFAAPLSRARTWLRDAATEEMLDAGGYRRVTGRTTPTPPENLVWALSWVVEALVRWEESAPRD